MDLDSRSTEKSAGLWDEMLLNDIALPKLGTSFKKITCIFPFLKTLITLGKRGKYKNDRVTSAEGVPICLNTLSSGRLSHWYMILLFVCRFDNPYSTCEFSSSRIRWLLADSTPALNFLTYLQIVEISIWLLTKTAHTCMSSYLPLNLCREKWDS